MGETITFLTFTHLIKMHKLLPSRGGKFILTQCFYNLTLCIPLEDFFFFLLISWLFYEGFRVAFSLPPPKNVLLSKCDPHGCLFVGKSGGY